MKQFMQLQPRKWKAIYALYLQSTDASPEEQLEIIKNYLISEGFSEEQASSISSTLIKTFVPELTDTFVENDSDPDTSEAKLSLQDIRLLKEKLLHEPSPEIKRLLVSFLVYARANPHPSFWIKYDRKVINFLASLQKLKVSEQILLTNQLHSSYNLDMQVVGSNQPIPCFRISWQAEQEPVPDTPDNPLVLLGPLNPATIKSFAEQIPYAPNTEETEEGE